MATTRLGMTEMLVLDAVDQWGRSSPYRVTADRTVAYAASTNDLNARHADGTLAPPLFALVVAADAVRDALAQLIPHGLEHVLRHSFHTEHHIYITKPIVPGQTLRTNARILGIIGAGGSSIVVLHTETTDPSGRLVNEQFYKALMRSLPFDRTVGQPGPTHAPQAPAALAATIQTRFDLDQPARYARASGDEGPLHTSDEAARAMGLPGIIIHGACTLAAIAADLIREMGWEPADLRRLGCRFSAPVQPGDIVTTQISRLTEDGDYAFLAANQDAVPVLRDGHVRVQT